MRLPLAALLFVLPTLIAASPTEPGYSMTHAPTSAPTPSVTCNSTTNFPDCGPDGCPHAYTFDEFKQGTGSNAQPYFRFFLMFKMNPAFCEAEAHNHWKTVHADLTMAARDTGVLVTRYAQYHAESSYKKALRPLLELGVFELAPWDGIAEFHAQSAEDLVKFMNGTYFNPTLTNDEQFVDPGVKFQIMGGYDTLIYGSGSATDGGSDGIMPGDPRLNSSTQPY